MYSVLVPKQDVPRTLHAVSTTGALNVQHTIRPDGYALVEWSFGENEYVPVRRSLKAGPGLCVVCGTQIAPHKRINAKTCSRVCRSKLDKRLRSKSCMEHRVCLQCGRSIRGARSNAIYCSRSCKTQRWNHVHRHQ